VVFEGPSFFMLYLRYM